MVKMITQTSLATVVTTSLIFLAACSSGSQSTDGKATKDAKPVTLRIMWGGSQERHDNTLKVLELYSSTHPNVKFQPEYAAVQGYFDKLVTLSAANNLPDIVHMDLAIMDQYVKRGQLMEITGYNLSQYLDSKTEEAIKFNGKLFGIPTSLNGGGLIYNKADVATFGIKAPHANWTWDEFWQFAEEARQKLPKDRYGVQDSSRGWFAFQGYQMSKGKGPVFPGDGTVHIDKGLWKEWQERYEKYRKNGIVPPADKTVAFKDGDPQLDPIASGAVLVSGATVASAGLVENLMPGKIGVVNGPINSEGSDWIQPTLFWSVAQNSKNKEEALKFAKWFLEDPEATKIMKTSRGIPLNQEGWKSIEPTLEAGQRLGKELLDIGKSKGQKFYPLPAGGADFDKTYQSEMESAMFGKQSLDQAFEKIMKAAEDAKTKMASIK
ncbi:ABC transporter substrate-binding protein [Paenibacillus piri]|nr:extracellular solute-binding protein [Paenibacillus piri]